MSRIQHDAQLAVVPDHAPGLLYDASLLRRVVDDPEGINKVKAGPLDQARQLFGVSAVKRSLEAEDFETLAGQRQARLGELDRSIVRTGACEVHGICADTASDLQNAFAGPALKLRKAGNMRLNEIFPL